MSAEPHNPALKTGRFPSQELISSMLAGSNPWWAFDAADVSFGHRDSGHICRSTMANMNPHRRQFLKSATVATAVMSLPDRSGGETVGTIPRISNAKSLYIRCGDQPRHSRERSAAFAPAWIPRIACLVAQNSTSPRGEIHSGRARPPRIR